MGTAPPSKPLKEPARPFQREQRRACLQQTFLPKARKDPIVLLHLISRREWQKVLIRVTLFPGEVTQRQKMTWYGVQWSLIPLHLACALQPPSEVISMLLRFHSDTARLRMDRCSPPPNKKRRRWHGVRRNKKKLAAKEENNYALYKSNQGPGVPKIDTAPSSSSDDDKHKDEHSEKEMQEAYNQASSDGSSLLDDEAFTMEGELSRLHVFETYDDDSTDSEGSPIAIPPDKLPDYKEAPASDSALHDQANKSKNDHIGKRDVALQLSASGSLEPLPVTGENAVSSKMHWNLDPLLLEADALLPLHIACLFRASPTVISSLLEAYPKAAQDSALRMLPIHMVCASFDLPPPVLAPPPGPVPFPHDDEFNMAESIRRLEAAFPEGLDYPSESNGMTPRTYIDETLDDGPYKDTCLEALGVVPEDESIEEEEQDDKEEENEVAETKVSYHDDSTLTTRVPDEVHCNDDNSTLPSYQTDTRYLGQDLPQINGFSGSHLYSQMVTKDWEKALATIEEKPEEGHQWQYGIELDRIETLDSAIMWKRLPIHSACVLHAPIGLIEALLWAYPKGIRVKDPFTGSLPLHLACRHSAPPELVKTIIMAYPTGSRIADMVGRLPLHMACLSGASRLTFIYLLKAYPHAVLIKDDRRRTPLQYANQNPTLKSETVELLQLVHHFLEKQPAVEDDYTFEGFSTPRSVCADDSSAVSGFYEDSFSVASRHSPNTDKGVEGSPSSRSRPLLEGTNEDRLAEEFSQILEDDEEEDDIAGRVTPKFGVSRAKREQEDAPEFSPMLEEDEVDDRVTPKNEEPQAKNAQEQPGEDVSTIVGSSTSTEFSKSSVKADGATVTLAKLVFLGNKREKEQSLAGYSIKAGVLTKELSQILEEDGSAADEDASPEKSTESNGPTIMNENEGNPSRSVSDAEEPTEEKSPGGITETSESWVKEESPLDRLSKLGVLMAKNEDGQTLASSIICLDGNRQSSSDGYDQSNSTESLDSSNTELVEAEATETSNLNDKPMPDEPSVETREILASKEEASSEGDTEVIEDIEAQRQPVTAAEVELNEYAKDDHKDDESNCQDGPNASKDATELDGLEETSLENKDDLSDIQATSSKEKDGSTAAKDEEHRDNSTEAVLQECHDEQPAKEDETNDFATDHHLSTKEDDKPSMMGFAPVDVAAGCSPLTIPVSETLSRNTVTDVSVIYGRHTEKAKAAAVEQAGSLDSDSVPYEPLVDEMGTMETAETLVDHEGPGVTKDEPQVLTSPDHLTSIEIETVSSTDGTVLASNCVQNDQKRTVPMGTSEIIDVVSPNDAKADEPHKAPSEDSTKFQFDNKSDASPTGESIDAESSANIKSESPEPDVIQERDDQNKTNTPKQEERLDHSCVQEAHV